jgi:hypothetical protein
MKLLAGTIIEDIYTNVLKRNATSVKKSCCMGSWKYLEGLDKRSTNYDKHVTVKLAKGFRMTRQIKLFSDKNIIIVSDMYVLFKFKNS